MKLKHWILILLIPLSEAKALFFNSNVKVSWYLFSNHKRFLCNVVEDYSNIIILSVVFYYMAFIKFDSLLRNICLFLFIINILDLVHLGLLDLELFIPFKLLLAGLILFLCNKSRTS